MPDDTTSETAPVSAPEQASAPPANASLATTTPKAPDSAKKMTFEEAADAVDFGQMTDEQFKAFESGDLSVIGGSPATPAEDSPQEQPGARQSVLKAQTQEELAAAGAALGGRVSIKALKPEDRARTVQALDLIRGGKSPADAFAEVFGIPIQSPAAQAAVGEQSSQEQPAAANSAPNAPNVAEMETKLATLQAQYKEAKETYDPKATDIMEEMTDLKLDLRDARREVATRQVTWDQHQSASHARARDKYSELITDEASGFLQYCDDEIYLAEAKNDPIIFQPDWPEKIGQRVFDKFFQGRAAQSAEPVEDESQATIPPAPRQSVRLPGSPVGPGFSAGALSPQTAMAELDKLTPEQQDAFIQSLDNMTSAKPLTVHSLR